MGLTLPERLTAQFYDWEQRGRGWYLFEEPVELEPPFHPFFFHGVPSTRVIDDGRRPTILSDIVDFIRGRQSSSQAAEEPVETIPVEPFVFDNDEPFRVFSLSLPKEHKVKVDETEQLLLMLSYCKSPVSFEIIGSHPSISLQLVCREGDALHVSSQLKAYFPESIIKEKVDSLNEVFTSGKYASIIDFGLRDEFMRPLSMPESFDLDPLIGIFGMLEHLGEDEYCVIQILFSGAVNPWAESIMRSVLDNEGGSFFMDAPDMVPLAKEKISSPFFGVTMRVVGASTTLEKAFALSQSAGSALARISNSGANSIIPLDDNNYTFDTRVDDLLLRESHRLGMLLNSRELGTFVHLPSPSVVSLKLERDRRKTKTPPQITEGHELILGINEHQGKVKPVTVSVSQRLKHMHVIGATGTGKSTLLLNLIVQDIKNGHGVCVLDPHGDLIESIISYIPAERSEDVCLIDPADSEYPIGFNILQAHSEIEKEILSSDLVAGFRRLSTSWGDQMNSVFANAILAFLESKDGGTLADLRRFLVEKSFRDSYLKTVSEPNVIYYWQKEYPLLRSNSIGSILTRLDTFLRPKLIRNMVAQKKGLDFEALLDTKKIVLIKLSQGLIGTENSYLLGTVIVSKIHQAAMARQIKSKEERSDFFLYIDEFQNFITPSMSSILSGARKYHLGLILAHQSMDQLLKQDSELASAVISNAGTRICFRVGDTDAKRFADGFSFFEAEDLQNLNTGEAIARIDRPEYDFSLTTESLPAATMNEELRNRILPESREKYGTPRDIVESFLKESRDEISQPEFREPIQKLRTEEKSKEEYSPAIKKTIEVPPEISSAVQTETTEKLIKQKEQSQHRYLQTLIKKMAESRGYKTLIEEPTPDGKGRVDVSLERNGKKIACEISMTTEVEWELHNIEKCLAAGYDFVIECSNDKRTLESIKRHIEKSVNKNNQSKVLVFEPEAFFQFLDEQIAKEASTETRMKGYRVKTEYGVLPDDVSIQKRENVLKAIASSIRKKKK